MQRGIKLFHIAGVDVFLDWSLLIIFFLISSSLAAGLFPAWHPDWSATTSWLTGLAAATLFLLSVLVHEMAHALVGRANGMTISRITLFIFGGMAHLEEEPRHWRVEFRMAIAGPITSLALGLLFIWAGDRAAGGIEMTDDPEAMLGSLSPVASLLLWLGPVNIVLAVFNLVPGFPLDGGRVMRAILWGITDDYQRATRWASTGGRIFGGLMIATGLAMVLGIRVPFFGTGLTGGLWLALIGWFLHNAAAMSYRQVLMQRALTGVRVGNLMQNNVDTVTPDLPLQVFVNDYVMGRDQRAWPVIDGGRLLGLVCMQDVR
ncbi:MAG TPA: site-2 protease family protein, partial [Woeseiaceae bacterium]